MTMIFGNTNENDVFLGRGGGTNRKRHGSLYRKLVQCNYEEYGSLPSVEKRRFAIERVVNPIQSSGGSFLVFDKKDLEWVVAPAKEATSKVMQALRDCKRPDQSFWSTTISTRKSPTKKRNKPVEAAKDGAKNQHSASGVIGSQQPNDSIFTRAVGERRTRSKNKEQAPAHIDGIPDVGARSSAADIKEKPFLSQEDEPQAKTDCCSVVTPSTEGGSTSATVGYAGNDTLPGETEEQYRHLLPNQDTMKNPHAFLQNSQIAPPLTTLEWNNSSSSNFDDCELDFDFFGGDHCFSGAREESHLSLLSPGVVHTPQDMVLGAADENMMELMNSRVKQVEGLVQGLVRSLMEENKNLRAAVRELSNGAFCEV